MCFLFKYLFKHFSSPSKFTSFFKKIKKQKKASKCSYFQYDCILSGSSDFIALSISIHQYLFYRKGLEFIVIFSCLTLINLTFFTTVRVIISRMNQESNLTSPATMMTAGGEAESCDNWFRVRYDDDDKRMEGNYCFGMVIDEINSIYRQWEIMEPA